MNKIKFNLYDQLWYIFVWLYVILTGTLLYVISFWWYSEITKIINIESSLLLVFVSYIIWHIIQWITNWLGKDQDNSNKFNYIKEKAYKFFDLKTEKQKDLVFSYCNLYSLWNDISWQLALFNWTYSLYRWLFIWTALSVLLSIWFIIYLRSTVKFPVCITIVSITLLIIMIIFYQRKKRFHKYTTEKTYIIFDILLTKNANDKS